ECRERLEHLRTALGMSANLSALMPVELVVIVNHVEESFVNLSDVVEQGHALDEACLVLITAHRVRQNERISRDAAHVSTGNGVVCVNRVQQRLERCGTESLEFRERIVPFARRHGGGRNGSTHYRG